MWSPSKAKTETWIDQSGTATPWLPVVFNSAVDCYVHGKLVRHSAALPQDVGIEVAVGCYAVRALAKTLTCALN